MSENVFIEALKNNKPVHELQQLIADNPSLEIPGSAIFYATKDNIDLLLDMGLDINYSKSGSNALSYIEDIDVLKILVSKGLNIKTYKPIDRQYKSLDMLFYLIELGVKINYNKLIEIVNIDHSDESCLKLAESFNLKENEFLNKMIEYNNIKTVKYLSQEGMKIEYYNLYKANSNEMFDLLLELGADISSAFNSINKRITITSLQRFLEHSKNVETVTYLLEEFLYDEMYEIAEVLLENSISFNPIRLEYYYIFKRKDKLEMLFKYNITFKNVNKSILEDISKIILENDTLDICIKHCPNMLEDISEYAYYIGNNIIKNLNLLLKNGIKVTNFRYKNLELIPSNQKAKVITFLIENGINLKSSYLDFIDLGIDVIDVMLRHGFDINYKDKKGKNALFYTKKFEIISYLIEKGIDVNCRCEVGTNALTVVNNIPTAKALIEAGIDIHNLSKNNVSCLWYQNDYDLAKFYIDLGINIRQRNTQKETALVFLIKNGKFPACKALLEAGLDIKDGPIVSYGILSKDSYSFAIENGADIHHLNAGRETNLFRLIRDKHYDVAIKLIELGIDVNFLNEKGVTAFYECKDNKVLSAAIRHGLKLETLVYDGSPILRYALSHPELMRDVVRSKFFDPTDLSILKHIYYHTNYASLEILLQSGLEVKGTKSSFYYRSPTWKLDIIKLLIEYGMDISENNNISIDMVYRFKSKYVQDIIKNHVNINFKDARGKNLIFYSSLSNIKTLESLGLDINSVDNEGKTFIFYLHGNTAYNFDHPRLNINHRDNLGKNALYYVDGNEIVKKLIFNGIGIDDDEDIFRKILRCDSCTLLLYILEHNPEIGEKIMTYINNQDDED